MREITFAEAFAEGIREEMHRDPNVFVIGTDIRIRGGHFGQLKDVGATFGPKRVIDSPISEAAMLGLSLGAAMTGLRPVCDLNFEDFILGGMDEVVNQMAKIRHMFNGQIKCPVVIRGSTGSARSAGPQHSQAFESWYAHTPGLLVANPSTPEDVKGLLKSALRGSDPVIFLTQVASKAMCRKRITRFHLARGRLPVQAKTSRLYPTPLQHSMHCKQQRIWKSWVMMQRLSIYGRLFRWT